MDETTRALLADLKEELQQLYGERLKSVYLFGSYARGEQDRESDIDVLVVLDEVGRYGAEVDRTSQLTSELSLRYGVSISKVFVQENDWLRRDSPFLANVREEAVRA